ncbi:MAG: precorrin-2 dehydrogenase/sirohydrochlorin ferrochelatase family protein [Thermodesulfobacteriota bacterium]
MDFNRSLYMNKKRKKATVYYPIFFNTQGKKCVVIGGGNVALRKIKSLLECRAKVTVISPRPHPEISKLSEERMIRLIERDYKASDLKDAVIAIVCTDSKKVNRKVADEARKAGVLVNVADDPEGSDFIIPSFFRRGDLTVAVSTSGVSPALAKKIRAKLEKSFGAEYASLLSLIGEVRSEIRREGSIVDAETWQGILDIDLLTKLVKAGSHEKAKALLLEKVKATKRGNSLRSTDQA